MCQPVYGDVIDSIRREGDRGGGGGAFNGIYKIVHVFVISSSGAKTPSRGTAAGKETLIRPYLDKVRSPASSSRRVYLHCSIYLTVPFLSTTSPPEQAGFGRKIECHSQFSHLFSEWGHTRLIQPQGRGTSQFSHAISKQEEDARPLSDFPFQVQKREGV